MTHILIAVPNDTLGGAEQYLKMIATYHLKQRNTVHILFLKMRIAGGWDDLKIYPNVFLIYTDSASEKKGLVMFVKNVWSLRQNFFEYVFTSHVHLTGLLGMLIKTRILDKHFFVGRESTSIFKRFSGLKLTMFKLQYYFGYSAVDLLICQTEFMKSQLIEALPWLYQTVKVVVLPNPVDIPGLEFSKHRNGNKSPIEKYGRFIVSAGRLIPEKGFDLLVDAFRSLKADIADLKLVILGEGHERQNLTNQIERVNLSTDIYLEGFQRDVYPYFRDAELCVVSSRIEGFPNVLLQMMSQNSRVVATRCAGGIDEIQGLFVCDTNNVEALRISMVRALTADVSRNREIFNLELSSRSVEKFIDKINLNLSGT